MKKRHKKYRSIVSASLVALLGGFFILGLTPKEVEGTIWHWPTWHKGVVSTANVFYPPQPQVYEPQVEEVRTQHPNSNSEIWALVLMYHHVADMSAPDRVRDPIRSDLTVSVSDFESQVKYLASAGYETISAQDLYDSLVNDRGLPAKPIIFTFDDGYSDVFINAIPILQKYNFKGSFAIPTNLLGRPDYATWEDVTAADKSGMEILSHTENHLDLTSGKYSEDDLKREIFGSKTLLEANLGHTINFFVYPYGHGSDQLGQLLNDANYKMAFTTEFGVWQHKTQLFAQPRVRIHGIDGLNKLKAILPK